MGVRHEDPPKSSVDNFNWEQHDQICIEGDLLGRNKKEQLKTGGHKDAT